MANFWATCLKCTLFLSLYKTLVPLCSPLANYPETKKYICPKFVPRDNVSGFIIHAVFLNCQQHLNIEFELIWSILATRYQLKYQLNQPIYASEKQRVHTVHAIYISNRSLGRKMEQLSHNRRLRRTLSENWKTTPRSHLSALIHTYVYVCVCVFPSTCNLTHTIASRPTHVSSPQDGYSHVKSSRLYEIERKKETKVRNDPRAVQVCNSFKFW